jgi:hypothetical protein
MSADPTIHRAALSVNLLRIAESLDAISRRVTPRTRTTGRTGRDSPLGCEYLQARTDAGAAVWEAIVQNVLDIPELLIWIEQEAGTDTDANYVRLFDEAISELYSRFGEGVFPYYRHTERFYSEDTPDRHKPKLAAEWERHELQEQATGCRVLAKLIDPNAEIPGGPGRATRYLPIQLADMVGVCTATVNKYARMAKVPTPKRGKRNHRYTRRDALAILGWILRYSTDSKRQISCQRAIDRLKQ